MEILKTSSQILKIAPKPFTIHQQIRTRKMIYTTKCEYKILSSYTQKCKHNRLLTTSALYTQKTTVRTQKIYTQILLCKHTQINKQINKHETSHNVSFLHKTLLHAHTQYIRKYQCTHTNKYIKTRLPNMSALHVQKKYFCTLTTIRTTDDTHNRRYTQTMYLLRRCTSQPPHNYSLNLLWGGYDQQAP